MTNQNDQYYNPYAGFVGQGGFTSPESIPDSSKLLSPPQPSTALTQIPKTKERGGFFDPLISKEAVQKRIPGFAGTALGTVAEFTTSPFDLAVLPTWAIGGPAISAGLKGAKALSYFPKGLKWFPKVLGSIFEPFPGTRGSLPARLLAEAGAATAGGYLATEAAEVGDEIGGTTGSILGAIGGGLVGGTAGGLLAVGGMKGIGRAIAKAKGTSDIPGNGKFKGMEKLHRANTYFPAKSQMELEMEQIEVLAAGRPYTPINDIRDLTLRRLQEGQDYFRMPIWLAGTGYYPTRDQTMSDFLKLMLQNPETLDAESINDVGRINGFEAGAGWDSSPAAIVEDVKQATSSFSDSWVGKNIEQLPTPIKNMIHRVHRVGNPMSASKLGIETISATKNRMEKIVKSKAARLYDWAGLPKAQELFGEFDNSARIYSEEAGKDIPNIYSGRIKEGFFNNEENRAIIKAAWIKLEPNKKVEEIDAVLNNLSLLKIIENVQPLDEWGNIKNDWRAFAGVLNEDQKRMIRRYSQANEYIKRYGKKEGIDFGDVNYYTKGAIEEAELADLLGFTDEMLEAMAPEITLEDPTGGLRNEFKNNVVNYVNRVLVMKFDPVTKEVGDIAVIAKDGVLWRLGKRTGSEYSRRFSKIEVGEAEGYVYMSADTAFLVSTQARLKSIETKKLGRLIAEMVESGEYVDFRSLEVEEIDIATYELLFKEIKETLNLSDEEIARRINIIKNKLDGWENLLPEQVILRDKHEAFKLSIQGIIDKFNTPGFNINKLSQFEIEKIKSLFQDYPHHLTDNNLGEFVSDVFSDKLGIKFIDNLNKLDQQGYSAAHTKLKLYELLNIDNDDEAKFLVTFAWARRIMGDDVLFAGKDINGIQISRLQEVIDGRRIGTEEDTEIIRRLIDRYKDTTSEQGKIRTKELETELNSLLDEVKRNNNRFFPTELKKDPGMDPLYRADNYFPTREWFDVGHNNALAPRINKIQAKLRTIKTFEHSYKQYHNKKSLDFLSEDWIQGLRYKKENTWILDKADSVFADDIARLIDDVELDDAAKVQQEDTFNMWNSLLDQADVLKTKRLDMIQVNKDTDIKQLTDALRLMYLKSDRALMGHQKKYTDKFGNESTINQPGLYDIILEAENIVKYTGAGLDDVVFLDQPMLENYVFRRMKNAPAETYNNLIAFRTGMNKALEQFNPTQWQKWWVGANTIQRMVALGFDASIFMIQLLPAWFNHPEIGPKVFTAYWKALITTFKDPEAGRLLLYNYRNLPENHQIITKYGANLLLSEDNEIFEALTMGGFGELITKTAGVGRVTVGFKNAFDHVLDVAGIEMAKGLDNLVDSTNPELAKVQMKAVADYVNAMRGLFSSQMAGVPASQRYWESMWLLAARYRRAVASLYGMALSGEPERRYLAHKAIINVTTGTTFAAVGLQMMQSWAAGDSEEEILDKVEQLINPTKPGFLMFNVNGQSVGPGSKFVQDARTIGRAFTFMFKQGTGQDVEDWQNFMSLSDDNPGLLWVRGQLALSPSTAWSIFTGSNYIGEPVFRRGESDYETLQSFLGVAKDAAVPIWISSMLFENGGQEADWGGSGIRGATELIGMRTHPQSSGTILRMASYDKMSKPYSDLEPFEKDLLRHSLVKELTPLQEEQVRKGKNDYAIYFNNIERINIEFQEGLKAITLQYPDTPEGNRDLYTTYRGMKSHRRGQLKERGYDAEFREPNIEDETDLVKIALARYHQIYDKAVIPGTFVINWDRYDEEYDKLMSSLTLDQQVAITRNNDDLPMPPEFLERLAKIGKKEHARMIQAQMLREEYFIAADRPDLAEEIHNWYFMLED